MELTIIQQKIYEVRHQKVMLDFDLAELYQTETKRLNEQVKRNRDRFPEDFMIRLTVEEWDDIRSQIATASGSQLKKSRFFTGSQKKRNVLVTPYAFTEHGVTMLASVLRSEKAVKMNIAIVRAFIAMRQIMLKHKDLVEQFAELRQRVGEHDAQLNQIYNAIENLLDEKAERKTWQNRERIGFGNK